MKTALLVMTWVAKVAGFVSALGAIPMIDPKIGVIVVLGASVLKDTVNRIGDIMDDGQANDSFKP